MKDDVTEFQSLLQSLAAEKLAPVGAHRTPDELAAYHFHQLSAAEEDEIQDHLVTCRACTMLLLDLAELCATEPAETAPPVQTEVMPTNLAPTSSPATATFFQRLRDQLFPFRLLPTLAALSLLLSLSLGVWVLSLNREKQILLAQLSQKETVREAEIAQEITILQQQKNEATARAEQLAAQAEQTRRTLDELNKPQLNTPVIDVLPRETRTERTQGEPVPEIARRATRVTLVIPATITAPKYPDYAIEILNQSGTAVVNEKGLRLTSGGSFTIALSSQSFAAGEYRVNVYGLGRGARARVAGGVIRFR